MGMFVDRETEKSRLTEILGPESKNEIETYFFELGISEELEVVCSLKQCLVLISKSCQTENTNLRKEVFTKALSLARTEDDCKAIYDLAKRHSGGSYACIQKLIKMINDKAMRKAFDY